MESSPTSDSAVPPPRHPPSSSIDATPDDYRPNPTEPYTMPQQIAEQAFDTYPHFSGSQTQASHPAGTSLLPSSSPSPQPPISPYNPSAALALAKSLAKTSSDLHDAAKELNRHASLTAPELEQPVERERKNSVKVIVEQFENQLSLDRKNKPAPPTQPHSAISSHSNLDYSDDDDMDDNHSELSFSMDSSTHSNYLVNPSSQSGISLSLTGASQHPLPISIKPPISSNPVSRASTPSSINFPPSSPSSSVNQYISSTEVSPVPFDMLVTESASPPSMEEPPLQPHYKLSAKFESKRFAKTPSPTNSPVPSTWKKYTTSDANNYTYYYNEVTGESSWDPPPDYISPPSSLLKQPPTSPPKLTSSPPPSGIVQPTTSMISAASNNGTPLHIVSSQCSIQGMQLLISNGAEVNSVDSAGNTPLHKVCCHPKDEGRGAMVECVNLLLECGADANISNSEGNTALHLAVLNGHESVVSALATHPSCDIGILDSNGQNALHLSAVVGELGCMQVIVLAGQQGVVKEQQESVKVEERVEEEIVEEKIVEEEIAKPPTPEVQRQEQNTAQSGVPERKASPWIPCTTASGSVYYYNTETGDSSWENPFRNPPPAAPPIREESAGKNETMVKELPTEGGGTLTDDYSYPPLSAIPSRIFNDENKRGRGDSPSNDSETDNFIDADDDAVDADGQVSRANNDTHMAIWNKFFQNAMKSQIGKHSHGPSMPQNWGKHLEDDEYFELLELSLRTENQNDQNTKSAALFASVLRGEIENVEKVLLGGAVATCADKSGRTPLHHACRVGDQKIVAVLCDYGADVDFTDSQGNSPLHIAAVRGTEGVLRFLLESASVVHTQNKNGDTALHLAVWHGNKVCVAALLEYGADVDSRNAGGLNCFENVIARSPMAYKMPKALRKTMRYVEEMLLRNGIKTSMPLPVRESYGGQQYGGQQYGGQQYGGQQYGGQQQQQLQQQPPQQQQQQRHHKLQQYGGHQQYGGAYAHQQSYGGAPRQDLHGGGYGSQQRVAFKQPSQHHSNSQGGRGILPPQEKPQLQQSYYAHGASARPRSPISDSHSVSSFDEYGGGVLPPPPPRAGGYSGYDNHGVRMHQTQQQQQQQQQQQPPMYVGVNAGSRNSSPSNMSMRSSNPSPTGGGGNSSGEEGGGNGSGVWGAVGGAVGGLFGKLFSPPGAGGGNGGGRVYESNQLVHDLTETMSQSSYNSRGSGNLASISSQMPPPPPPPPRSPPVAPPPTDKDLRRRSSGGGGVMGRGGTKARLGNGAGNGDRSGAGGPMVLSQPPLDVQIAMKRGASGGSGGGEVPEDVRKALELKMRQEAERESRAYGDGGGGAVRDVRRRYVDVFGQDGGGSGQGGGV